MRITATLLGAFLLACSAQAQIINWSREDLIKFTPQWTGERFPDGRPKVSDEVIERVKKYLSAEDCLGIARRGFPNQYTDGWKMIRPGTKLVGRAMTLQVLPTRQDLQQVATQEYRAKGGRGGLSHQTALDMLQNGDVFVVDFWGNETMGGLIGNNLAYYVWKTTNAGFVIDGPIRDLSDMEKYEGLGGFYKRAHPDWASSTMVAGINTPISIGNATVMPGDIVLADSEGIYFLPPHLVEELADEAEITVIHDEWTQKKFDTLKYKSTDIYSNPRDPELIKEYQEYLKQRLGAERYAARQQRQPAPPAGRGGAQGPGGPQMGPGRGPQGQGQGQQPPARKQ